MTDSPSGWIFPMRPLDAWELECCQSQFLRCVLEAADGTGPDRSLVALCVLVGTEVSRIGRTFGAVGLLAGGGFDVVAREVSATEPRLDGVTRRGGALSSPGGEALGRDIAVRRVAAAFVAAIAGLGGVVVPALDGLVATLGEGRDLVVGLFGAFVLCALEARVDPELVCALLVGDNWR